ncbi:MAG: hypothetical protein KDB11_04330 [Planctomycetales bacterium]|nr:hypothetical protein [Planctomycetales bacterium]
MGRSYQFALLALGFVVLVSIPQNAFVRGDETVRIRPIGWRRTACGWEDTSCWHLDFRIKSRPTPVAAVHPLVLASLELMISVGVLVIGSPPYPRIRRKA